MTDRWPFTTRAFEPADVGAAAGLLAARQRRLRALRPELPVAFTEAAACEPPVRELFEKTGAYGVVLDGPEGSAGFLLGYPRTEEIWGRAAWSPAEGSALGDGVPAEAISDLYAAWSEHFARRGCFLQYAHVATDEPELLAAWVRTGFGIMQAYAVRDTQLAADRPPRVTIRRAEAADIDLVEDLLPMVAEALMRPPAYAINLPETWAVYRADGLEELQSEETHAWLAVEDGRALAMAFFYVAEAGPFVPDGAWELSFAMTRPEERGRGLMRAIAAAGMAEARAAGASHVIADWRTASLSTHRSWTALGFEPTHYRLHRHLDERWAWASAAEPG